MGEARISSRGRDAGVPLAWLAAVVLVLAGLGGQPFTASARAEGCPNDELRGQDGPALQLPDCRAYEQVSPAEKNFTDAVGEADITQSSPSGDRVTFFSDAAFPGVLSATGPSLYLSSRTDSQWSTQGLVPVTAPSSQPENGSASVLSLTEDLSEAIVNIEPGLEAHMASGSYSYLRNNTTSAFQLLGPSVARFADASADNSRIIFESTAQLLPTAAPKAVNLYEWDENRPTGERLSLAGVLPDGKAPEHGSVAGPGGPALGGQKGGATGGFYTQDTISEDGLRIFFTDVGSGQIYMREPQAERTIPVSAGIEPAYWRAATTDGSYVFYTEGENLFRFNAASEAREALTSDAAGVLGTLGIATENGSYVYFVATSVLAGNENANKEKAETSSPNLYVWHGGETIFIARLGNEDLYDEYNWRAFYSPNRGAAPAAGEKSSRVTPNGTRVLFTSQGQLTRYDNSGQGELYLYDASSAKLTCVSCNPSGAQATSEAYLAGNPQIAVSPRRNVFLTRNLSENGNRVFFQTQEALVPQDTDGQMNVYEWEAPGEGTCAEGTGSFSAASGGCLYLISTGESAQPSYFGDASTNGNDVFFFTRQSLVGQDHDENYDVYDARIDGGIAGQNPSSVSGCVEEGCLGPVDSSPTFSTPTSATFAGVGNLASKPAVTRRALTRAQKLANALHACRRQKVRKRRTLCEANARRLYGKRKAARRR